MDKLYCHILLLLLLWVFYDIVTHTRRVAELTSFILLPSLDDDRKDQVAFMVDEEISCSNTVIGKRYRKTTVHTLVLPYMTRRNGGIEKLNAFYRKY